MTGVIMTEHGEGELLEARRRRKFWLSVGFLVGVGAAAGFFAGAGAAINDVPPTEIWATLPKGVVIALIGASLVAFFYGCWRFLKAIDEVELADNLWGSTASYYVYATLFPVWWALGKAAIVPEPHDWAIYFAALGGGLVIYLWRKWIAR